LFQYYDDEGDRQTIDSGDVNDYLQNITQTEFTAKDFRTWAGTVVTATALRDTDDSDSKTARDREIVVAIKQAAQALGNRYATCRQY
jgi:DNA topoisomerase-1